MLKLWSFPKETHNVWATYFSFEEACRMQELRAITGLDASGTDSWKGVAAPNMANFERARKNLQTPKCLRLGPLLVAAVEAVLRQSLKNFLSFKVSSILLREGYQAQIQREESLGDMLGRGPFQMYPPTIFAITPI
jgi:hypothetical protein